MIRQYLINKTNRETLLYKFIDKTIFNILRIKAVIFSKKFPKNIKKLHLGCGHTFLTGFLNSDILGDYPIDITKNLPFKNNSIEFIYNSNLIEHIYLYQFQKFLKESYRVLKPKGEMIIITPCLDLIFKNKHNLTKQIERYNNKHSILKSNTFSEYLNFLIHLGYGHKYLYDTDLIIFLSKQAGFKAEVNDYKDIKNPEIVKSIEQDKTTLKITGVVKITK